MTLRYIETLMRRATEEARERRFSEQLYHGNKARIDSSHVGDEVLMHNSQATRAASLSDFVRPIAIVGCGTAQHREEGYVDAREAFRGIPLRHCQTICPQSLHARSERRQPAATYR